MEEEHSRAVSKVLNAVSRLYHHDPLQKLAITEFWPYFKSNKHLQATLAGLPTWID